MDRHGQGPLRGICVFTAASTAPSLPILTARLNFSRGSDAVAVIVTGIRGSGGATDRAYTLPSTYLLHTVP